MVVVHLLITFVAAVLIAYGVDFFTFLHARHANGRNVLTGRKRPPRNPTDLALQQRTGTWRDHQGVVHQAPELEAHAALTVADVALLQALGWEAPPATAQRVQRTLEGVRNARPPRPPVSPRQRALAELADDRIAAQWGGTPSQRQQILANEADSRIARGDYYPFDPAEVWPSQVVNRQSFGGHGLHAERERLVAREIERARKDDDEWRERLRRQSAALADMEASLKLVQAGIISTGSLRITPNGFYREP